MPQKKQIAIFLGAGASKAFNYPLVKEILPQIIQCIKHGQLFKKYYISSDVDSLYLSLIQNLICYISPGLTAIFEKNVEIKEDELPLITDILSQAENILNRGLAFTDFNFDSNTGINKEITTINERWNLKEVIRLLEMAIICIIDSNGQKNKNTLNHFFKWISKTNIQSKSFISFITSNYDTALEWNLLEEGEALDAYKLIDYGFNWRDIDGGSIIKTPANPRYRIYKLHGSTDWLSCARCGYIYINTTMNIFDLAFSNKKESRNSCHCKYWPLAPVLVSPSFSRTVNDTNLSQIWRNALELLRKADEWVIIGYSLPAEDFDIKSLFIRALAGREKKRPIIKVIQQSKTSEYKYDNFFGKGNYTFIGGGLEKFDLNKINLQ